ncbi:MAG: ABC transporter ATP-binding protein [Ignavibacteriae bacterium]|nr:ABC transporter ATP-binding protein [Ignavibacteriota bacterium]
MIAIAAESLSKTYTTGLVRKQRINALIDFSLHVEAGQIFGLLGPNGAGKTTFIKTLLSLVHPTSGKVHVLETRLPNTRIRSRIGYLPENHRFPGYLTGEQVLLYFGQLSGVGRSDVKSRITPLLELVGMSQWRRMKVRRYSKGMMQRIGLAQALINDPEVIFLDEPTDGVDPVGRKEIRDILQNLKRQGKTIFLNSHLLSEVELISDRVAILDKGRLLTTGTVDELTAGGYQYQIGIEGTLADTVRNEASAMVMNIQVNGNTLSAELKTTAELNRLIDLLRRNNIPITSIIKKRDTLEDSFINLIKREVAS